MAFGLARQGRPQRAEGWTGHARPRPKRRHCEMAAPGPDGDMNVSEKNETRNEYFDEG